MRLQALNTSYAASFKSDKRSLENKSENPKNEVKKPVYDKNPIKKSGEKANAILATVVAGLGFGARLLWGIFDSGEGAEFVGGVAHKVARKIQGGKEAIEPTIENILSGKYNPNHKPKVSLGKEIGGTIAVLVGFVGLAALLYTLYNTPKAMYDAKVNTVKKQKDMDVYIRGNAVEKELYDQMNEKAKDAGAVEKERLNLQYAKLKAAKNVVPDFVKLQR